MKSKRIVSFILTLCMTLSLVSVTALAEEGGEALENRFLPAEDGAIEQIQPDNGQSASDSGQILADAEIAGTEIVTAVISGQQHASSEKMMAASEISYVERSWNGGAVTEETKTCSEYTEVQASAVDEIWKSGWYLVKGDVTLKGQITINGTVNLILSDGATLIAEKNILVSSEKTLNIYGQNAGTGTLTVNFADTDSNSQVAGIGGGGRIVQTGGAPDCGTVTIHGGTVTAKGGKQAAGIGGGYRGKGGTVTIYGGAVRGIGGQYGAGIGGGDESVGGTVNIYGGDVNVTGGRCSAGIGGARHFSYSPSYTGGAVNIYGGSVKATGGENGGAGIGGGQSDTGGPVNIYGGSITATGGGAGAGIGGGLQSDGNQVTIQGGEVTAKGGKQGAGIGSGDGNGKSGVKGGEVVITGGTVTATGGLAGAGIGGGYLSAGGTARISGGEVITTGGGAGAGIGGGYKGAGGTAVISGGIVTAAGGESKNYGIGKGIGSGSGNDNLAQGSLTIEGEMYLYGSDSEEHPENNMGNYVEPVSGDYGRLRYMTVNNVSPHIHSFTYTAEGPAIKATCTDGCKDGYDAGVTLTLSAAGGTYDGTTAFGASLEGLETFCKATGLEVNDTQIEYYQDSTKLEAAPVNAGSYTAKLTVEGKTASVDYVISKAALSEVRLSKMVLPHTGGECMATISGVFAGTLPVPEEAYTVSGLSGTDKGAYDVTVTAKEDSNFSGTVQTHFHIVTQETKLFEAHLSETEFVYTGAEICPEVIVTDAYTGEPLAQENYSLTYSNNINANYGARVQVTGLNGYQTPSGKVFETTVIKSFTISKAPSSVTAAPAAAENLVYNNGTAQTLVTEGQAEGGTLEYALGTDDQTAPETGYSADIPSGTDAGTYYVWYRSKGDENHSDTASACVAVVIAKAQAQVKEAPTAAENLLYTGSLQNLIVEGAAEGGEMEYGLGTETEAPESYSPMIPAAADLGTYYVWYRVAGDENHTDSDPNCVLVTIQEMPGFITSSLVLSGQIGINFFLNLPVIDGVDYSTSFMTFETSGGGTVTEQAVYDPSFKDKTTGKYSGFTCYVNAIQMADTITATFHYTANGIEQRVEQRYSVKSYLDTVDRVLASNPEMYDEKTIALLHSLADYGHYVQPFLSQTNGWTIGTDYAEMDKFYTQSYNIDAVKNEVSGYAIDKTLHADIGKITFTLLLDSNTAIYVYFTPADGYNGEISFAVDGTPVEAVETSGRYLVKIEGIPAHLLGTTHTVTATTTNGTSTAEVSAMSYIPSLLQTEAYQNDPNAQNAMAALYHYFAAAKQYKPN